VPGLRSGWYVLLRSDILERVSDRASGVYVPPQWPTQVDLPCGDPAWEQSAVRWMLELVPGEWRSYRILVQNPIMLARDTRLLLAGQLQARRDSYARARTEIAAYMTATPSRRDDGGILDVDAIPNIPYPTLDEYLQVHAEEGERLKALLTQVQLVEDALTGVRWVPTKATMDWTTLP
jgi:hypothetical protein